MGGAVAAALTERFPELEARVYGAPLLRSSDSVRVRSFRHQYDPISILDRGAVVNRAPPAGILIPSLDTKPTVVGQSKKVSQ